MFRKKHNRMMICLIIGAVFLIIAIVSFGVQKKNREDYLAVKNGKMTEAQVFKAAGHVEGERNKYLYVFTADGKEYASSTINKYYDYQVKNFLIRYAVKDGKVAVIGGETAKIAGKEYQLAVSYEDLYIKKSATPSMSMSIVMFFIASALLAFGVYNLVWIFIYRDVEKNGTLTYAVFIEAFASRSGSNRYMAIRYKYKNLSEQWVESVTPYTFSITSSEKLMLMETFKIRYKGKRSMIIEDTGGLTAKSLSS